MQRAYFLRVLKQQLYPGRELAYQRRAALAQRAPGGLDLAEYFGLGDELAFKTGGKTQQERIGVGALEALKRTVVRKFAAHERQDLRTAADGDAALAGIDRKIIQARGSLGSSGARDPRTAPVQDLEIT